MAKFKVGKGGNNNRSIGGIQDMAVERFREFARSIGVNPTHEEYLQTLKRVLRRRLARRRRAS